MVDGEFEPQGTVLDEPLRPVRDLIGRAWQVGNEVVTLFWRPQLLPEQLQNDSVATKKRAEESEIEGLGDRLSRLQFMQSLSASAVNILRIPADEVTEDDKLRLKKIAVALVDTEQFSLARMRLPHEDTVLFGAYLRQLLGE